MITFTALSTETVRACQAGGPDAYGNTPEPALSDGDGAPCRHCLKPIPKGAGMLILAHCPFDVLQPYAETGPIFICADPCARHVDTGTLPQVMTTAPDYLIKGYSRADRIVYGTGAIVGLDQIIERAAGIFENPHIAYIHIRSARNNCYQARIDR